MPKIIPEKEQMEAAEDFGYELGVMYRKRLIAWLKKLFRIK